MFDAKILKKNQYISYHNLIIWNMNILSNNIWMYELKPKIEAEMRSSSFLFTFPSALPKYSASEVKKK